MQLKKILLTLIACGLLWSFQSAIVSGLSFEKSEIADASLDKENSEEENCELENTKFFSLESDDLNLFKIALLLQNRDNISPLQQQLSVPTSPPNV